MNLSIIIVSWKVREKLKECLSAIYKSHGDFVFEVFVIDNNSQDGTAEMVKNEFKQANLTANEKNFGLSMAVNQAKDRIKGGLVLLLNPDNIVKPDTLINMLEWMRKNKQADVASCCLKDEKGNIIKHVRKFPTVWNQLAIILKLPHIFPKILNNYIINDFDYSVSAKVDSVRGSFFMIRKKIIDKIGLWDERYFIWFEEVDYCRQIAETGHVKTGYVETGYVETGYVETGHGLSIGEVWYTPAAECLDCVGQSFAQVGNIKKQKYFRDSMLKYFKKWHPAWQYWILRMAWPAGMFIAWIFARLKIKSRADT